MIESKDFNSNISSKLENGNGNIVSFDGQPIKFQISNKEV